MTGESGQPPGDAGQLETADEAALAAALAGRAREEPVRLLALTDEELTVLDSPNGRSSPTPRPWLDGCGEPAREAACQAALRGLAARGIVIPAALNQDGGVVIAMHSDITAALAMRRSADLIVCAVRQSAAGPQSGQDLTRMLFCSSGSVIQEDISPIGLHGFLVTTPEDAARQLTELADPQDTGTDTGDSNPSTGGAPATQGETVGWPRTVSLDDLAAGTAVPELDSARFVTTVGAAARPSGDTPASETPNRPLTIYAFGDHLLVAELATTGEPAVTVTPATTSELHDRLRALFQPAAQP